MDFAAPNITKQGNHLHVSHGSDQNVFAQFSLEAIEDQEASLEAGRPIFKSVEMVTIRFAGDTKTVVVRPVKYEDTHTEPSDLDRFPRQWAAFKAQQEQVVDGTPITEWPPISKAMALSLKGMNIHTVEALASCADSNLTFMGGQELRQKAKLWLESAGDGAVVGKLQAEIDDLKAQLIAKNNEIKELSKVKKNG